jgi:hypothetical protein
MLEVLRDGLHAPVRPKEASTQSRFLRVARRVGALPARGRRRGEGPRSERGRQAGAGAGSRAPGCTPAAS